MPIPQMRYEEINPPEKKPEVKKTSNITDKQVACGMYMLTFLRVERAISSEVIPL